MVKMVLQKIKKRIGKKLKFILLNTIASSFVTPRFFRCFIYRLLGIKTETTNISSGCLIFGNNIIIGKGTFINYRCVFDNAAKITIGNNCDIAHEVMFCTATHEIGNEIRRASTPIGREIIIEDGCWIGTRVTILPGVKIGRGCIIGAGSLVTKDCEPNGLYIGSPARRVKDLDSVEIKAIAQ
jgi:maltose O-acetyltransferase